MEFFVKNYLNTCMIEFSKYGFKQKKQTFVRVVNDVMQNFAIERLRSGRVCRINFSVIPLCLRIEKEYILGGVYSRELRRFETAHETMVWDGWEYDPKSKVSSNACVDEIVRYLKQYLIPLFERANCCKTALSEIIAVDQLFYNNHLASKKINGIKGTAGFDAGLNLLDGTKYYMALKNGDYDFALECRKALLNQNFEAYNSMNERGYLTEEDKQRREKRIMVLKLEVEKVSKHDESYIQKVIIENEAYSLNNLKSVM